MMTRFMWIKRKPLATVVICAIILAASFMYWPKSQVAEAAIIDPHPGLVGWWRFDEATGTTAGDSSGFGNDGTIYGATWITGKYGQALSFDGTNDYVDCGSDASLNSGEITIIAWVKHTNDNSEDEVVSKWGGGDNKYVLGVAGGNNLFAKFITAGGQNTLADSNVFPDNIWTFVTATWNAVSGGKLYINGILVASVNTFSGNLRSSAQHTVIGSLIVGSIFNWKGTIDEVRIYNQALSATEIQEIFQKRPDFSSKLLAKVPKGTTQVIVTVSWQGIGTINAIMESPSKIYTESNVSSFYQKNVYSITGNTSDMLNIKRLSELVSALSSDENWYIVLTFDNVEDYRIIVEVQK